MDSDQQEKKKQNVTRFYKTYAEPRGKYNQTVTSSYKTFFEEQGKGERSVMPFKQTSVESMGKQYMNAPLFENMDSDQQEKKQQNVTRFYKTYAEPRGNTIRLSHRHIRHSSKNRERESEVLCRSNKHLWNQWVSNT
ncbi:hypothetical protein KIN20_038252 [Parelaphostrongylus tenuis]|uniref:Uncharacterized protein n=1 Tax=Parelaphostrongylus tenuis TaxID=148309 RepID=A0AAD5RF79_PARTN|nr:hypothetical protein KIN20_038252 [Parelaphostrongylus tenuis]